MANARLSPSLLDDTPRPEARLCDHPGCEAPGEYRAPKARDRLNDYFWFCLEHVRSYNKAWNYCAGMSDDEVESMVRRDTVWQRPSWPLGSWHQGEADIRSRVHREFGVNGAGRRTRDRSKPGAGAGGAHGHGPRGVEDHALDVLDLSRPVEFATIKARYKALVKQHHPDANGGSREAEERLKSINHAYGILKAAYAS